MLGVLLLLQQAGAPPACPTPDLCRLLERAEAVNTQTMMEGGGYRAVVETESATLSRREGRMEAATLLQQNSGVTRWSNDIGFDYHVVGSRSYSGSIPLSRLALLRIGWLVPTLAGTRLQLITQSGTHRTSFAETASGSLAPAIVVHPLAPDRDDYYRFEGGSAVTRVIDHQERQVLAIEVTARTDLSGEETLFDGELDLDPETLAVVRLIGRIRILGRVKSRGMFRLPDFEPEVTLVNLVNQRLPDGNWAPLTERFEIQTASRLEQGAGASRRVTSRFYRVEPIPPRPGGSTIGASTIGYQVTSAPRDSLHRFRGWSQEAGRATEEAEDDFRRFQPDFLRPTGSPLVMLQGFHKRDFLRVNRIEGLYTGLAAMVQLRDAAPGVFLHGSGGYAWWEKTVRAAGGVGWEKAAWRLDAGGGRSLEVTNKFRNQFDSRALSALVGRDAWDYLDRYDAGASLVRRLGSQGSQLSLEGARVRDAAVSRHLANGLISGGLRPNRGITEGRYWRGRATLDWNPEVSPLYAHDGVGFRGEVEYGSGDLDYTRVEGRLVMRKNLTKLFFIARLHAGAVIADHPPPQQLFEIGGPAGLPGYEYKEFAGDRAALFRMRLTYPLALLDLPWRINSRVTIPALAPAISVGFQGGFTDTRNAGGTAAVRALGDRYDYKTGDLVIDPMTEQPLPASRVTDRVRTSIDIRVGFFGDALAVGLARALEKGRKTRFLFAFGRQF